jgi:hypothetical protein
MTDVRGGFPEYTQHWIEISCQLTADRLDITNWLRANVKGKYSGWLNRWRFQRKSDAALFLLTWQ